MRGVSIRLGVPCYAGDTLTFSGRASRAAGRTARMRVDVDRAPGRLRRSRGTEHLVRVTGRCSLGEHVTGTVRVLLRSAA